MKQGTVHRSLSKCMTYLTANRFSYNMQDNRDLYSIGRPDDLTNSSSNSTLYHVSDVYSAYDDLMMWMIYDVFMVILHVVYTHSGLAESLYTSLCVLLGISKWSSHASHSPHHYHYHPTASPHTHTQWTYSSSSKHGSITSLARCSDTPTWKARYVHQIYHSADSQLLLCLMPLSFYLDDDDVGGDCDGS